MALEEYIKQVKEIWTNYTLDLVNYQNKCRLIRCVVMSCDVFVFFNAFPCSGWDDLFTKCSENLNSLVAMKLSPYYKGIYRSSVSCIHVHVVPYSLRGGG